jgi:two-component SAPR family response regulator
MPGMSGLELASHLVDRLPQIEIIFITAYKDYALEAFRVHALDYLLKPVGSTEIASSWEKVKRRLVRVQVAVVPKEGNSTCFGRFEVFGPRSKDAVHFSTAKVEELMAFLLVHRDIKMSKWEISEQLWPDSDPDKAEQNLHTAIYRLKKSIVEHSIDVQLEVERGTYRLSGSLVCDFNEFERMLARFPGLEGMSLEDSEKLFALYRGPLFGNKDYLWSQSTRERVKRHFSLLGRGLAYAYLEAGAGKRATETLQKLIEHDFCDEESYELLLETYAHLNERASFLQYFDRYQQMLESDLGLKVKPRMLELRQLVMESK